MTVTPRSGSTAADGRDWTTWPAEGNHSGPLVEADIQLGGEDSPTVGTSGWVLIGGDIVLSLIVVTWALMTLRNGREHSADRKEARTTRRGQRYVPHPTATSLDHQQADLTEHFDLLIASQEAPPPKG